MTVIGAGQIYDRLISFGGVSTSLDSILWTPKSNIITPFPPRNRIQCMATNGTTHVAACDNGLVGVTTDLNTWWQSKILGGNFSPRKISYGQNGGRPVFAAAGQRKYDPPSQLAEEYLPGDEVGEIVIMEPSNHTQWLLAFTNPMPNSILHSIKFFDKVMVDGITTYVWVAVGSRDFQPEIWYSLGINFRIDNGAPDPNTWQQVPVPSAYADRPVMDVCQRGKTLWFSGRGFVLSTDDLAHPDWTYSQEFTDGGARADFASIAANTTGTMVAVSSGSIISTKDAVAWSSFNYAGYSFRSVIWHNNLWIVGASSDLVDKTYFTSTDGLSWTPRNNGLQMYALCSY
jgi:hypothetical protein